MAVGMTTPVERFCFARITDTHIGDSAASIAANAERVAALNALTPRPAFVVNTGDLVDEGTASQYRAYDAVFSHLALPQYDMPGNHDVRWAPLGKESIQTARDIPLYRSFDYGGCHFVLLDTTVLLEHWGHFEADQMRWLADDLEKTGPITPVFVFIHHWVGRDPVMVDNEGEFLGVLAPYNVKIVFSGHGHNDLEWRVNGVQHVMARGLYQGSFEVAQVTLETITLLRYGSEDAVPAEIAVIPTQRQPSGSIRARLLGDHTVSASCSDVNLGGDWQWRIDSAGEWRAMTAASDGLSATADLVGAAVTPGRHTIHVRLVLPGSKDSGAADCWFASTPWTRRTLSGLTPLWQVPVGGTVQSRVLYDRETVYVSCFDGVLYALDARTGRTQWQRATGGPLFSPPTLGGQETLYVGSLDHSVYAMDPETGRSQWETELGGPVFAGVRVGDGVACVGAGDGLIYGLDARTGARLWTCATEGFVQTQAAFGDGAFYIGAWDNHFYALEAATGTLRWRKTFGPSLFYSPAIGAPDVWQGLVFVPSNDDTLHAVEMQTGEVLWERPAPAGSGKFGYSGPVLTPDGRLFIATLGDTGTVLCLDARSGDMLWRADTGSVIYDSSCAVAGGVVTVGSVSGDFHAIQSDTGRILGTYHLGDGHLLASPAMTPDGLLAFIGTMGNLITALQILNAT